MNIDNLSSELKFANRIGQTLCTEEVIGLQSAVLRLSHEYQHEVFELWGRIEGAKQNYYVVAGVNFKGSQHFPSRKYFWRYLWAHLARRISNLLNWAAPGNSISRRCRP